MIPRKPVKIYIKQSIGLIIKNNTLEPGDLRAVSQSLAAAALKESEQEASRILKPSPKKIEERPNINLMQKLKTSAASPDARSTNKPKRKEADNSPLPRRKFVDVDNIPAPSTPVAVPSASPKVVKKEKQRVPKLDKTLDDLRSPEPKVKESEHPSSKKRKSTTNEDENSVIKKRKSSAKSDSEEVPLLFRISI